MRRILVKSTIALALSIAPGLVFAQTEPLKKKPTEQTEGQGGTQNMQQGKPPMNPEGRANQAPSGEQNNQPGDQQGATTKQHTEQQGGSQGKRAERGQVSEKQRGELKEALRGAHVEPAPNVNFSVGVGERIPREVRLHRLPPRIVEMVPEYEGYEYFMLADGRIVIVDPQTLEIVLAIE